MRIKYKLFLLILVANITLALVMYGLTLHSFSDGFTHYIEKTESQKLMPLVEELASIYEAQGNWDWVHSQHHQWRRLIDKHLRPKGTEMQAAHYPPPPPRHRPLGPRHSGHPHPPHAERRPPPRGPFPDRADNALLVIDTRIFLKDQQNKLVIGDLLNIDNVHWIAIKNNVETLGYVGYVKKKGLQNRLDEIFVQEQQRSFLFIALALIFLSILFALPAAGFFVRPLNKVSKMLAKITSGDYSARLQIKSTDELGVLSKDLNILAQTLQQNLQARQQWVADISHELRTPVAILRAEVEAIQDGVRTVNENTFTSLHYETERLTRLINDLHELTLADIGALSYQKQAMDILLLVQERVDSQQQLIKQSNMCISTNCSEDSIILHGDIKRLEQLVDNLLQNSIRYTDQPGTIKVSMHVVKNLCTLTWEDSSPGVNDQELAQLTTPLFRTEQSRNRNTGGSGLGLAICRKIVEAHQGTIQIEHSSLGGLACIISIPCIQQKTVG